MRLAEEVDALIDRIQADGRRIDRAAVQRRLDLPADWQWPDVWRLIERGSVTLGEVEAALTDSEAT